MLGVSAAICIHYISQLIMTPLLFNSRVSTSLFMQKWLNHGLILSVFLCLVYLPTNLCGILIRLGRTDYNMAGAY